MSSKFPQRKAFGFLRGKQVTSCKSRGQSLIGILLTIAIGALVLALGAQIIQTSLKASEASRQKNIASQLAQEAFEATKAIAQEDWHLIYDTTVGQEYYLDNSSGKWELSTDVAKKTFTLDKDTFSRWIVFNNVSRDSNGEIEAVYNASHDDPSTRKVTVIVALNDVQKINWSYYLTRWENEVAAQANWTGSSGVEGPVNSFGSDYSSGEDVNPSASGIELETE